MPLSGISRRTPSALGAFTFRELLTQRRIAERALARGRGGAETKTVLDRIEAELSTRRAARIGSAARPPL